jgi:hypothetical protein
MHRLAAKPLKLAWRIGVVLVGTVLLVAGIIMIVTPGPAVVFIPLGLAVLATEFQWARNLLSRARPIIDRAIEKAKATGGPNGGSRHPPQAPTASTPPCGEDVATCQESPAARSTSRL